MGPTWKMFSLSYLVDMIRYLYRGEALYYPGDLNHVSEEETRKNW